MSSSVAVAGLGTTGPMGDRSEEVLTPRAPAALLHRGEACSPGRWDVAPALSTGTAPADGNSDSPTQPAYERMP